MTLAVDDIRKGVYSLCELGNRFVGTSGESDARDWLLHQFRSVGLDNVRAESFPVLAYRPKDARCSLSGEKLALSCSGLQFTATGEAEGEVLFLGRIETVEDLERLETRELSLEGRLIAFQSVSPYIAAKYFAENGAAGLIVLACNRGSYVSHFTAQFYPPSSAPEFKGRPLKIPGVIVSAQNASRLISTIETTITHARVFHAAAYDVVETANIVGELPGYEAQERVVLSAHYDTQREGVGACDNATGVSALLAIARAWRTLNTRRAAVFVASADEEHGCAGAVEYCSRHEDQNSSTVGAITLDALGWREGAKRSLVSDPSFRNFALESCLSIGWEPDVEVEASKFPGSDYNAFIDAGVPAAFFWRYPPPHPYYHTAGDLPDLIDFSIVTDTATVAAHTAVLLADDGELDLGRSRPTRRWPPD